MHRTALALAAVLAAGCISTTVHEDGSREVRSFGAAAVRVQPDGTVATESIGVSEGFGHFLLALPNVALAFFGRPGVTFETPSRLECQP